MNKVEQNNETISSTTRELISKRYKTITKAINRCFWNETSDTKHSLYVGSYGRGTAIDVSDVDIIVILPDSEKERFDNCSYNGQSYLLQVVKDAIVSSYPNSDVHADGQVVVINFSDEMKFEIVPVFENYNYFTRSITYIYPDTNDGGKWKNTNPKAEQEAINYKNNESNGLLKDTCRHIRRLRSNYFSSYHLSGILIDSFVYAAIGGWHWMRNGEVKNPSTYSYEESLLNFYNECTIGNYCIRNIYAPGSNEVVNTADWEVLGKILKKMVI